MLRMMPRICLWLSAFVGPCVVCSAQEYNPLETVQPGQVRTLELIVNDSRRSRELPIRVYLPPADAGVVGETAEKSPVVLFSHGLGGSRQGSAFLGKHWAARGYIAAFLQHPGSDDSVWKDVGVAQRMAALQQAASTENYLLRVQDVSAVLDQLEKWNAEPTHVLHDCLDLERVGLSGHSFGAQTTQAVAGQAAALGGARADRRVKAAVIMSPGVPALGSAERAFGRVSLPWLLMTGTNDTSPIGKQTVESRRQVYAALPAGDKYELVLHRAEHSAFTERSLPGDKVPRNPNHHRAILALSTAFWDTYLRGDHAAKAWLAGDSPRTILQDEDIWQSK